MMASRAPWAWNSRAAARPIPLVAPVITQALPASLPGGAGALTTHPAALARMPRVPWRRTGECLHPNSVRYRLRRIAQLTGHDPHRVTDLLDLHSAARLLGHAPG